MWGLQLFLEDVLKITNIRSIIIYHNKQANWHTSKIWKEYLNKSDSHISGPTSTSY